MVVVAEARSLGLSVILKEMYRMFVLAINEDSSTRTWEKIHGGCNS